MSNPRNQTSLVVLQMRAGSSAVATANSLTRKRIDLQQRVENFLSRPPSDRCVACDETLKKFAAQLEEDCKLVGTLIDITLQLTSLIMSMVEEE